MPDPVARARHFRSRTAEYEALVDLCSNEKLKEQYRALARRYIALAEAEERMAQSKSLID